MTQRSLVLASTSPFRRELLARLGLAFDTAAPDCDETPLADEPAPALVQRLAEAKARAVAAQFPEALIIGSDQVACLDDQVLGKPGNRARALDQLRAASGRKVAFQTGLCLYDARDDHAEVRCETYQVEFRVLSEAEIAGYVDREQPFGCAGSFKSEGLGSALFERLEGDDPTSLIGLPLIRLAALLRAAGVDPLRA
ncbi:Maf family protein [Halochromatium salexigens]|uniref:7-methyl-GTP pyrophosphatase n=1 Tax=Halochromatium salexigens TaxID=49447 RepID=A0AAJ0XHD9_HALSE|nr:Maf family protein [Halochromatium salexigens]MBK5931532.1 septum formation inhibitor Maf [Halochromatium salexigens]